MNRILELREKRAKAWDAAKKFLDAKTGPDGLVSAEDSATYDKMEADVLALGKEVERLERQAAIDAALNAPANQPITEKPGEKEKGKAGRASAEYTAAFWQPGMWVLWNGRKQIITEIGEYDFKRRYLRLSTKAVKGVR